MDAEDPRQARSKEVASQPTPILVPPEVAAETVGVVHARVGYAPAEAVWKGLGRLANLIHLNTTYQEEVAPIFLGGEGQLSWVDAAVVAHCLREDAEPLCYDEAILAAWRARKDAPG